MIDSLDDSIVEKVADVLGLGVQYLAIILAVASLIFFVASNHISKKKELAATAKQLTLEASNKKLDSARLELEIKLEQAITKRKEAERDLLIKIQELALTQDQLAYLQQPRRLTVDEKNQLLAGLSNFAVDQPKQVRFASGFDGEQSSYTNEFKEIFRKAGWRIYPSNAFLPYTYSGVTLIIPVKNRQQSKFAEHIHLALNKAEIYHSVVHQEVEVDDFDDNGENWIYAPTIFVGHKSYTIAKVNKPK